MIPLSDFRQLASKLSLIVAALLAASCGVASDERFGRDGAGHGASRDPESSEALAVVWSLRERFVIAAPPGRARRELRGKDLRPVLREAVVEGFDREGGKLAPRFAQSVLSGVRHRAQVALPARANEPFAVTDPGSGLAMAVTLDDGVDVPAELAGGYVAYRGAHRSGADVVHRVTTQGTEDFLVFGAAPAEAAVTYSVHLGDAVAGLRHVANTIELLDASGTPRLRMAPPYLVDARGARHDAKVAVTGCNVDTVAAAPWGRVPTAPGASVCSVRITWSALVGYPAVLDPAWTLTGTMTASRTLFTANVLPDGRVLVAGGLGDVGDPKIAEIYDPKSGMWATTSPMSIPRNRHTASVLLPSATLPMGAVLVAAGDSAGAFVATAEVWDPKSGTWAATANDMANAHFDHTATVLKDGRVLVAAGSVYDPGVNSELFDPATGMWSDAGAMPTAQRAQHSAALLASGQVLVAGGISINGNPFTTAELYTPGAAGGWTSTGSMNKARSAHTATTLSTGKVLVAGGAFLEASTELYDPEARTWSFTAGSMTTARINHTATALSPTQVLVAGGDNGGTLSSAEIYDVLMGKWTPADDMATTRYDHTASLLGSGKVLVAGGTNGAALYASAELYAVDPGSTPGGVDAGGGGSSGIIGTGDGPCKQACDKVSAECSVGDVCAKLSLDCAHPLGDCAGRCALEQTSFCEEVKAVLDDKQDSPLASCLKRCQGVTPGNSADPTGDGDDGGCRAAGGRDDTSRAGLMVLALVLLAARGRRARGAPPSAGR